MAVESTSHPPRLEKAQGGSFLSHTTWVRAAARPLHASHRLSFVRNKAGCEQFARSAGLKKKTKKTLPQNQNLSSADDLKPEF